MTGIDLNQKRSLRGVLAASAHLYRRFPLLFAALALVVIAPYELAVLAITGYGPLRHSHESLGISYLLLLVRTSLVTPLVSAMHMHAVAAIGEGRRPQLREVAANGLQVLPVVAAAEIIANIGIALGFVALIVPGVLLALRWALVAQAAALEKQGWIAALRSSSRLTDTHFRRVFALLLLIGVFTFAVSRGAWAVPLGDPAGAPSVAVGVAIHTAMASLGALTLALLYFDLKASAEAPYRQHQREYPHLRDLD